MLSCSILQAAGVAPLAEVQLQMLRLQELDGLQAGPTVLLQTY